jgi:hypothetical protein
MQQVPYILVAEVLSFSSASSSGKPFPRPTRNYDVRENDKRPRKQKAVGFSDGSIILSSFKKLNRFLEVLRGAERNLFARLDCPLRGSKPSPLGEARG